MIKLKGLIAERQIGLNNNDNRRVPSIVHANYNIVVDTNLDTDDNKYIAYTKTGIPVLSKNNIDDLVKDLLNRIRHKRSLKYY